MVMVALCVLGLFSYLRLSVEQMPDVTPPAAFIDVSLPRRVARGGGARDQQAARGGAQRDRRRQAHHVAQLRRPRPDQRRVHAQRGHQPRDAGAARQGGAGAVALSARRQAADDRALLQRQLAAGGGDGAAVGRRARRASCRCWPSRSWPSGSRASMAWRTVDFVGPGHARGAHRPRPGAAAHLCDHAGRDRDRAARGQRRPAGGPAVGQERRRAAARGGPGARPAPIRRHGGRATRQPAADAGATSARWWSASASPTRWRA